MDMDKIIQGLITMTIFTILFAIAFGWLYDFQKFDDNIENETLDFLKYEMMINNEYSKDCLSLRIYEFKVFYVF
jgi:hypothetical protein